MSGLGRAASALAGVIILAGAAVAGAGWARERGYLPQPSDDVAAAQDGAMARVSPAPTPYDRFIAGDDQSAVQLDEINALCGFTGSIGANETRLAISGEAPGAFLIHSTFDGEQPAVALRSAAADQLHAYARYGELVVMLADGAFNARVFVLDEDGEPVSSDPLSNDAEWFTACGDAPAAAAALNTVFAERGALYDPVQEALDQFADGAVSAIATACGVGDVSTAVSGQWIIGSSVRREQPWDGVFDPETGDWIRGAEDFLDLEIARRWDDGAMISRYAIPLSESAVYAPTASGFGPTLDWDAIAVRHFQIWPDGSRAHSEPGDPVRRIDIPCLDIPAGEAALRAAR